MADYRVEAPAIDRAMSLLEAYREEIWDVTVQLNFMLDQQAAAVEREIRDSCRRLQDLDEDSEENAKESRRLEGLRNLLGQYLLLKEAPWTAYRQAAAMTKSLVEEGARECGLYLKKISSVARREGAGKGGAAAVMEEWTVVIDSRRCPQSAEHIRAAMAQGLPQTFTVDRQGRDARRAQNLRGRPARRGVDRDEWPAAVFLEGSGATVYPVDSRDNRSAGGTLSWQLRGLPDGTRVRVRVI